MLESQLLGRALRHRRAVRADDHADIGRLQAALLRQLLPKRLRLLELVGSGHQRQLAGETWLVVWKKDFVRIRQERSVKMFVVPACHDVIEITRNARQ